MRDEIIRVGQIEVRFLLEAAGTNGSLAMFEFTVPAGAKVPLPHSHEHYDETIYGVEGVITFSVNGKPVDIAPGESCFIQRGAVHGSPSHFRRNSRRRRARRSFLRMRPCRSILASSSSRVAFLQWRNGFAAAGWSVRRSSASSIGRTAPRLTASSFFRCAPQSARWCFP